MKRSLIVALVCLLAFASAAQARSTRPTPKPAPAPVAITDPSGVPMPTGTLSGWGKQTFADDFTETTTDWNWGEYGGQPNGSPNAYWDPSHDVISGGELKLETYKDNIDVPYGETPGSWVSGGLSNYNGDPAGQTYGKYEIRFRMDQGTGIGGVILLMPANGGWPPEMDLSEDRGANPRDITYATMHYGANDTQIQKSVSVDLTKWHTMGVEWTKGKLAYTLDGNVWATVSSSNVPSQPMVLDMQTGAGACGSTWEICPDSTTPAEVDMDVDWVSVWAAK